MKIKKFIAGFVAATFVLGSSQMAFAAPEDWEEEYPFDYVKYADTYADLYEVCGYDPDLLYYHYETYGKAEGRTVEELPALILEQDAENEEAFDDLKDSEAAAYLHMAEIEPSVSARIINAVTEADPTATFDGLANRLKSASSLYNKLYERGYSDSDISYVSDIIRYTIIEDGDNTVEAYFQIVDDLEKNGITVKKVKNYWTSPQESGYRGLNLQFYVDNYPIEIQIHTPESFEAKTISHEIYEEARVLDENSDEYKALMEESVKYYEALVPPKNIELIEWVK